MTTDTDMRTARQRQAIARAPRQHMDPDPYLDIESMGAEQAAYTEPTIDPQWVIAYKMFVDDQGEYGIPYPVPIGQLSQGAGALVLMRRLDGGYAWSAERPARLAPVGTLECIEEKCGDAHLGGKRKMLPDIPSMLQHVETFHPRAAQVYKKYLEQLADDQAIANPRLQALRGAPVVPVPDSAVYCRNENCPRYFDTEQGRDVHERSHKGD